MRRFLVGSVLAFTLIAGCGTGGTLEPSNLTAIRLYNGSPDSPPVDFFLRGGQVAQALRYGFGRTYILVQPGQSEMQIRDNTTDDVLLDVAIGLTGGNAYTFAITGPVASLQPVFVQDDTSAAPAEKFKIRVLHLAPLGPGMDLYITPTTDLSTATPVVTGAAYTKVTAYGAVPTGSLWLQLTQTGTKTVLWQATNVVVFSSGQSVTVFVIGNEGTGGGGAPYSAQLVADHG